MNNTLGTITALLSACSVIIIAIVGATWHLSTKIGDLRVSITRIDAQENSNRDDLDYLWEQTLGSKRPRPFRVPLEAPAPQ